MTDQQAQELEARAGRFTIAAAVAATPPIHVPAPQPDTKWDLSGGTAWVYYADKAQGLTRPVILADGFNMGPTNFDALYNFLDKNSFPLITSLLEQGRDVLLLGFHERSASILDNAEAAIAAVHRANAEKASDHRLMVGGFSMGGIITRYALARLEHEGVDHQTGVYFSYDSPHRGSWVPISLQAFADVIPGDNPFADQMKSPAARQMLWLRYNGDTGAIEQDPLRKELIAKLDEVGGWPAVPLKIAVANGVGTGTGNGVYPGVEALRMKGVPFYGTKLYTQGAGPSRLVADLKSVGIPIKKVHTDSLPQLDGAPGGTLEGFGILGDALNALGGKVEILERLHCFVPSVSAVDIRDLDDPYVDINALDPAHSNLDGFLCASGNEPHTAVTEQLCTFLLERLPD
ncbi:esterase/lipase family protein [Kitasatospora indigofera]|uniref:esterase/lipase family protein n=1 Tax=Kitasatospora indigofera TaxID=67307 RepID=UPI00367CD235